MSTRHSITVTCPGCRQEQPFDIWPSVNVSIHPHLKPSVLNADIFLFRCPGCGHAARCPYPLLYHDMDHRFIIMFQPQSICHPIEFPPAITHYIRSSFSTYARRITSSLDTFLDEIRIFDAGLDDRAVNALKSQLAAALSKDNAQFAASVRFDQVVEVDGEKDIQFVAQTDPEYITSITIPFSAYELLAAKLHAQQPDINSGEEWLSL